MAYVRAGHFTVKPGNDEDLIEIYGREAIPQIRQSPGNVSAVLLQQHSAENAFVAMTLWQTEADAQRYEASGRAAEIVAKVKHLFAAPPLLTTYDAFGIGES